MIPVIDLHCDLLLFLMGKGRTPYMREARCAFPQLQEGGVETQVLAIYTSTEKHSHKNALTQLERFKRLPKAPCSFVVAIENASGLLEEGEDFSLLFPRLDHFQKEAGPLLYVSLTWNTENRFGGGNASSVGLKREGELLLDYLAGKGIAIDLSHTSDALAEGILHYIDKKNLALQPIASHSNFRALCNEPRNLPDPLASEIIRRRGVIGLNLVRKFIGEPFEGNLLRMVEHAETLGGVPQLCMGADFFHVDDLPTKNDGFTPCFAPGFENSSCYPKVWALLEHSFSTEVVRAIAHENASRFMHAHRR